MHKLQSEPVLHHVDTKKTVLLPSVSEPQLSKIHDLRARMREDEKVKEKNPSDEFLERILYACKFNFEDSLQHFNKITTAMGKLDYPDQKLVDKELSSGLWVPAGVAKCGSPVLIIPIHHHDPKRSSAPVVLRTMQQLLDRFLADARAKAAGVIFVMDCSKLSLSQVSLELDSFIFSYIKSSEYERYLSKIYLCDGGFTLTAAIKLLKPFFWQRLMDMLVTTSMSKLKDELGPEALVPTKESALEFVRNNKISGWI